MTVTLVPKISFSPVKRTQVPFRRAIRTSVKSSLLWSVAFGIVILSSSISYKSFYPTAASRKMLQSVFSTNVATNSLFGPAYHLDQIAGFTVFKSFFTLIIIGALWAIFLSSKALRGEEENLTWEHVIAGTTTLASATLQVIIGLTEAVVSMWVAITFVVYLGSMQSHLGFSFLQCAFFALAITSTPLLFISFGALASQLFAERKTVNIALGWLLGISYALRLVGDSGIGLHWLDYLSPIGWVELLHPMIDPKPIFLLPIFLCSGLCLAASVAMASRRDLGQSAVGVRTPSRISPKYLRSSLAFSFKLISTNLFSWLISISVTGLILARVAESVGSTITGSSVKTVLERIGGQGNGSNLFLGLSFVILAMLFAFMLLGQVLAMRAEESSGHLDTLLSKPISRLRWFGGRIMVLIASEFLVGLVSILLIWIVLATEHLGQGFTGVLLSIVNIMPPGILVAGCAIFAFGWFPTKTSLAGYGILAWSMMVEIIAGLGKSSQFLVDTSIFHQVSPYPAASINWKSAVIMTGIGVVGTLLGAYRFNKRDIGPT
ncbi:MAG: hypothetical protein HKL80_01455 [Acidimicrobiales bacterium]|nr:hypothetical protein [Acidimicrobiales bacterium]